MAEFNLYNEIVIGIQKKCTLNNLKIKLNKKNCGNNCHNSFFVVYVCSFVIIISINIIIVGQVSNDGIQGGRVIVNMLVWNIIGEYLWYNKFTR